MKTAAAYIRVSTDDQLEFSPDSQIKCIREYAQHNDIILLDDHIYMDEGISGKDTRHREAFNRMIGIAKTKPKPFDVILVWKFSRFARNREDSIVYKSMLRKQCNIQVVSISESLGDDKTSILIEAMIEAMDEYYSINLAEEVRRGMTEKASRGGIVSAPPVGYKLVGDNPTGRQYAPDEYAPLIHDIFVDFVGGMGYLNLARKYADLGLRTTRGNLPDNRFIEYILRNPVYVGKIRWCADGRGASNRDFDNPNNIIVDGKHQPIVSADLWDQAQARVQDIKRKHRYHQRDDQPRNFMLKGLMRCSSCGSTLVRSSTACPSVQCHKYSHGMCSASHCLSIAKANKAVIAGLRDAVANLDFRVDPLVEQPSIGKDYDQLLARERAKLDRAKYAYINGIDTADEYAKNKKDIQSNINRITSEAQKVAKADKSFDPEKFAATVSQVIDVITDDDASEDTKSDALRSVISYIVYDKPNGSLQIYFAP